jgi:hypothetical protein
MNHIHIILMFYLLFTTVYVKVAFLAAGKVVYFGPIANLASYFSGPDLGFLLSSQKETTQSQSVKSDSKKGNDNDDTISIDDNQIPGSKYFNIADFVLQICSEKVESVTTASGSKYLSASDLAQIYLESQVYKDIHNEMKALRESKAGPSEDKMSASDKSNQESSFSTQFCMCFHRAVMTTIKDTNLLKYLVFSNLVMGLIIGIVYVGQGTLPSEPLFPGGFISTQTINFTTTLFSILYYPYILGQAVMHSLTHKIIQYEREMKSGAYGVVAVWLAEVILPIGFIFLLNWIYFIPAYFLIQLPVTSSSFFFIFFMVYCLRLVTYYLLMWFIAWSKDENIALLGYYAISLLLEYIFNGICILNRYVV